MGTKLKQYAIRIRSQINYMTYLYLCIFSLLLGMVVGFQMWLNWEDFEVGICLFIYMRYLDIWNKDLCNMTSFLTISYKAVYIGCSLFQHGIYTI